MRQTSVSKFSRRQNQNVFEGDCPNGGSWYSCNGIRMGFVGCCTVDPCTSDGCPTGNVRAASLGGISYGSAPDQVCQYGGHFFTCASTGFWGCCKSNACGSGCPQKDLAPASLSQASNNPFLLNSTSSARVQDGSDNHRPSTTLIAGVVIGGVLGIIACIALGWILRRKQRQRDTMDSKASFDSDPYDQQFDEGNQYRQSDMTTSHPTSAHRSEVSPLTPIRGFKSPIYPQRTSSLHPPKRTRTQNRPVTNLTPISASSTARSPGSMKNYNHEPFETVSYELDASSPLRATRTPTLEIAELPATHTPRGSLESRGRPDDSSISSGEAIIDPATIGLGLTTPEKHEMPISKKPQRL